LPLSLKMVRTTTAPSSDLLLDTYTGAAAAYSVRKLDKDYTGYAIRVREDSGDTEADIGFDSNGDLDTAAIATHCGSANGYVVTWYDQSGNSNNATQSTAGSQPQIYNGTAVITENGKPALNFTSDYLDTNDISISAGGTFSTFHVEKKNSASSIGFFMGKNTSAGSPMPPLHFSNGNLYMDTIHSETTSENKFKFGALSGNNQNLITGLMKNNDATSQAFVNGSELTFTSSGTHLYGNAFNRVGGRSTIQCDSKVQEFVLYLSEQADNRSGIESDINTYFSIYP